VLFGFRNLGFPRGSAPNPPDAPTVAAPTQPLSLTVSWSPPSFDGGIPITSYILQRRAGAGEWILVSSDAVSPYTDTNLTQGVSYTYRVAAVNAAGASDFSLASNAQTAINVPSTPAAPTATASTTVSGRIDVSWSAPANGGSTITSYTLQRDTNNNVWTTVYTGPNLSFINTGLNPDVGYRYRVLATNAAGNSAFSAASAVVFPWVALVATGGSIGTINVGAIQYRVHTFSPVGNTALNVSKLGSQG